MTRLLILIAALVAWALHLAVAAVAFLFIHLLDYVTAPAVDLLREAWDKTKENR